MPKKKKIIKKKAKTKIKKVIKKAKPKLVKKEAKIIEPVQLILQPPKGMKDILPVDEMGWTAFYGTAEKLSRAFGYKYIETPILEYKGLFVRGIGDATDVVQKEMYCFKDQGGDDLCLRPEGTAAVMRAYIDHGMLNLTQPVKLWYLGPFFRRERPQSGRYRQFHQWGLEVLGDGHPVLDAEVISIAVKFFKELNIPIQLEINSIGDKESRSRYIKELGSFYESKKELLCNSCKMRFEANRLRLLDCKQTQCQLLKEGAPEITEFLSDVEREHFMKVLEHLDDLEIPYALNPYLVRGLDYYSRTVFEIFEDKEVAAAKVEEKTVEENKEIAEEEEAGQARSVSLCGGGRYDGLSEALGGRPTPAVGCSFGFERVLSVLRRRNIKTPLASQPKVFIAQLGEAARRKALNLMHQLYNELPASSCLSKEGLKAQLEIANRLGVRYVIIIGQKEIIDKTAIIRDMEAGIQEVVDYTKLVSSIKKKLLDA